MNHHQPKDRNALDDSQGAWQPSVQDPFQPADSTTNQSLNEQEEEQESLQWKPTDLLSQKPEASMSFFVDWVEEESNKEGYSDSHHKNYELLPIVAIDDEEDEEKDQKSYVPEQRTIRAEMAVDLAGNPIQLVGEPISEDEDHQCTQNNTNISHEEEDKEDMEHQVDEIEQYVDVDPVLSLQAEEILFQAMTETTRATKQLEEKEYLYALDAFVMAIGLYKDIMETSGMAVVNAANCYRNMAAISVKLQTYDDALEYFRHAVVLYNRARVKLMECPNITRKQESVSTMDGKLLDDSNALPDDSCFNDDVLCLDTIIVQTLQQQANIHIKYNQYLEGATVCHELIARHLVDMVSQKQFEQQTTVEWEGISYTTMTELEHTNHLGRSLQTLGSYYTETIEHNKTMSLVLYEEALDVLQTRLERYPRQDALIHSVSLVLRYLSEIYFLRRDIEPSVDALHDSMAVKLSASGEPDAEALKIMDKMGAANEKSGNWNKARSCFEQSLVARCQFYGKTSLCVAKTLANLGRVVEKQNNGPTDESSELLKAANSIYALYVKALASPILSKEVDDIIQQVPGVESDREQTAHKEKAILKEEADEDLDKEDDRDKAQIYFDLGRSYMSVGNLKMAKTCLISAIKEADQGDECELHSVLQSLEFVNEEEAPPEEVKSCLDVSIQSLGTILSYGKTEFSAVQFSDLPVEQGHHVDYLKEASDEEPSWANFSVHTEARNWKKPTAEEEKTNLDDDDDDDLENDPNYNLLYESFRMESSDRTPKVGNVATNRLVVQTALHPTANDAVAIASNGRGFGIFSCWQKRTGNAGVSPSKLSSASSSTRKTTVKQKLRRFVSMVRQSTTDPFIRKDDDNRESQQLLLTTKSSGDDTLAVSSFDDSPISTCVSPSSRQWRTGSGSTTLGVKEKKRNISHRRAFI